MIRAYYCENDPFAVEWLKILIAYGLIAEGDVDNRSIADVEPNDLAGYTQCHFFAGIGGWSYALRLAGWPDSRHVWTLSCPCQPFSAAGKGVGFADERHLWPVAHWLIAQRRPITIFGEQVASKDGLNWFDIVSADLENTAYSSGAVDICAAGIGAPHIRQRLYFRSDSLCCGPHSSGTAWGGTVRRSDSGIYSRGNGSISDGSNSTSGLAGNGELQSCGEYGLQPETYEFGDAKSGRFAVRGGTSGNTGYSPLSGRSSERDDGVVTRLERFSGNGSNRGKPGWFSEAQTRSIAAAGATRGFWNDCDWWHGSDKKYRPIEPGLFPLAHGISGRVGKLRGYGNAIVPELAAEFIQASEEVGW